MPATWDSVASNPAYKSLPQEQKDAARQQYFNQVVAPQVPKEQLDFARQQFDAYSVPKNAAPSEPGILSRIGSDLGNRRDEMANSIVSNMRGEQGLPSTALQIAGATGGGFMDMGSEAAKSLTPDFIKNSVSSGVQGVADTIDNTSIGQRIGDSLLQGKDDLTSLAQNNPVAARNIAAVANIEGGLPVMSGLNSIRKGAAEIGENAAQSLDRPEGVFPKAMATPVPPVDPRIAQIVKDADTLGINIPSRVFHPGVASDALTKAGLMSGDTMKSDVTTALSKVMGHEGTPNLDTDVMNGIQKNIGGKMDSFALKADESGGIPVSKSAINTIADESLADDPKVAKLLQKVHDRVDENARLSGADYQALTKKGGVLDRAMSSADSEFSDTAKKIRGHLDDQLEQTVNPDDLEDFKNTRRQYRTLKIVQPLVESGGVTGQPDSASKLFSAVSRNYGSISNALKYNPELGKIAQIVNEFPEAVKNTPKAGAIAKIAQLASAPAAIGVGAVGGIPAGVTAAAALPIAKGVGMYLSSPARKAALLAKSLPEEAGPRVYPYVPEPLALPAPKEQLALTARERPMVGDNGNLRPMTDDEWNLHNLSPSEQAKRVQKVPQSIPPTEIEQIKAANRNAADYDASPNPRGKRPEAPPIPEDSKELSQIAAVKRNAADWDSNYRKFSNAGYTDKEIITKLGKRPMLPEKLSKGGPVKKNLTAEFLARAKR